MSILAGALQTRDIRIVVAYELKRTLRSPHGLIFLAAFLSFFAWVGIKAYDATASFRGMEDPLAQAALIGADNAFFRLVSWFTDIEVEQVRHLVVKYPPALLGFFLIALFATPLLAMLGSMDQTGSDIHSKHMRYLLLRTDRSSLFLGKMLAALLFQAVSFALATYLTGLVITLAGGASVLDSLFYMTRVWLSLTLFAVPIIALLALCNALVGNAFLAVLVAVGFHFFVWAASSLGGLSLKALKNVQYLYPTAFKYRLLSNDPADLFLAIAHMAAFAAIFTVAGLLVFRSRDV